MSMKQTSGGNFELEFEGDSRWARFLTRIYPKLRAAGLVYGNSAMFAKREVYERTGGFRDLPFFEDVDLYKRLSRRGDFVTIKLPIKTSTRRFENGPFVWTLAKWFVFKGLSGCAFRRAFSPVSTRRSDKPNALLIFERV